jgi:hypothetical protein
MKNVLFFDSMLTPKIITAVYWLLLAGSVIGGIGSMFGGFDGFTFWKLIMGIAYAIGGIVASRIGCELMIVLFKMNEALQEIRHK